MPYVRGMDHGMDQSWIATWGWPVLALVNAGLAEQKNRSRLTWFLVSLFLGPLATFLIVTWERAPERPVAEPRDGLTNGLLAVGVALALLAVVSGVVAAVGGDTGIWVLAAGLAVVAAVAVLLHVLAHRRWAALRAARAEADASR